MERISYNKTIDIEFVKNNIDMFNSQNDIWDYYIGDTVDRKTRMKSFSKFLIKNGIMTKGMKKYRKYESKFNSIDIDFNKIEENCIKFNNYKDIYDYFREDFFFVMSVSSLKKILEKSGYSLKEMKKRQIAKIYNRDHLLNYFNYDIKRHYNWICPNRNRFSINDFCEIIYNDMINNINFYIDKKSRTLSELSLRNGFSLVSKYGRMLKCAVTEIIPDRFIFFENIDILKYYFKNKDKINTLSDFSLIIGKDYSLSKNEEIIIRKCLLENNIELNKYKESYFDKLRNTNVVRLNSRTYRKECVRKGMYFCFECGISEYNGKPITLDVDHIDYNPTNNKPENLRLLCPNCHSQIGKHQKKIKPKKPNKQQLLEDFKNMNLNDVLIKYKRRESAVKKWCFEYDMKCEFDIIKGA